MNTLKKYRLIADLLELDQIYRAELHAENWHAAHDAAESMAQTCRKLDLLKQTAEDGTVKP